MRRSWSIVVGTGILIAVAAVCWQLIAGERRRRDATTTTPPIAGAPEAPRPETPPPVPDLPTPASSDQRRVHGIVLSPTGRGAAGATVTLHRLVSPWPEWRREPVERVVSGADGTFTFRTERARDQVVEFSHPANAGDLVEAPPLTSRLVLQLRRGFEVTGTVLSDSGSPVAGARVALEATAQSGRVLTRLTNSTGRFQFTNVPAGTARLIAHHELWQPASLPALVVGVDRNPELQFRTPAATITGTVVAGPNQQPVAGATVLASWPVGRLGLIEPVTAVTGGDGTFRLPGLGRGKQWLEVRHPDWATATAAVAVGTGTTTAAFELQPRTRCEGRLTLTEGTAWPSGPIGLRIRTKADELAHCVLAADGSFAFAQALTPGFADLELIDESLAFARSSASVINVRLEDAARTELALDVRQPSRLTGRVVTRDGTPVAGANLFVTVAAERFRQAGSALFDLELIKASEMLRLPDIEPERLLATTAADGTFTLSGQRPGPLQLRLVSPGHGTRRVELVVPSTGSARTDDLVVEPGGRIVGRAVRSGTPQASAQISVTGNGVQLTAISDAGGTWSVGDLQPGDYRVRARLATVLSQEQTVRVTAGARALTVLEFRTGRVLNGTVTSQDGLPVEGAMLLVRGSPGIAAISDAAGAFAIEVPERAVEIEVATGDRARRKVVAVDAVTDKIAIQVDTPPSCTVTMRVAGLPGRAHPTGALLRVDDLADPDAEPYVRWVEMQNGMLRHPWFPAGRQRLRLWCEGFAPYFAEFDNLVPGSEHRLDDVLLEPGCELRGRVVDPEGKPVADAQVFLGDEADADLFVPQLRSGADGTFTVRGVTSTAATLVVRAPGHAITTASLRLPHAVLGGQIATVRLDLGSTIRVRVGARAGGGMVALQRGGRVLATAEAGADGIAVFAARAAGDYTLVTFGELPLSTEVHLPGGGQAVDVDLP